MLKSALLSVMKFRYSAVLGCALALAACSGTSNDSAAPSSTTSSLSDWTAGAEENPFTKQVEVFGIYIYATDMVADDKMLHTADVLAQYLDNDEDGTPDNQKVVDEIVKHGGGIFMTEYEGKYEWSELDRIFDKYLPPGPKQSVYDSQTYPNGRSPQRRTGRPVGRSPPRDNSPGIRSCLSLGIRFNKRH